MIITIRSIIFNAFMFAYALLSVIVMTLSLPFPRPVLMSIVRAWPRVSAPLFHLFVGIRHEFRGIQNIPDGPFILASKHQSAWDTMAFYWVLNDPAFILKKELLALPLYGWCARKARVIGVDRSGGAKALRSMVEQAKGYIDQGRPIIIFPEGTRTVPGQRLPDHPGIAALYTRLNVPVVPVALNSGLFWGRRSFVKYPGCIAIEFLPPIPPGMERRAFMTELTERIETANDHLNAEAMRHYPYLPRL